MRSDFRLSPFRESDLEVAEEKSNVLEELDEVTLVDADEDRMGREKGAEEELGTAVTGKGK